MKFRFALFLACAPYVAGASVPMRQPSPEELAAARLFAAELPLEQYTFLTTGDALTADLAGEWLRFAARPSAGPERTQIASMLALRLRLEIAQALPGLRVEVEESLAADWAMRYTVQQMEAARIFYASEEGSRFAAHFLYDSVEVNAAFAEAARRVLRPRLEALAAQSAESFRLIDRVNAGQR